MKSNLALSLVLLFGLVSCSYLAKADGMPDSPIFSVSTVWSLGKAILKGKKT